MSEVIKAGVMVKMVKPTSCCGNATHVGDVYVVRAVMKVSFPVRCVYCETHVPAGTLFAFGNGGSGALLSEGEPMGSQEAGE